MKKDNIRNKSLVFAVLLFIFGLMIAYKLLYLYIYGEPYRQMAKEKTFQEVIIEPNRGNLYSDDGSLLATSVTRYDIRFDAVAPSDKNFELYVNALSDSLAKIGQKSASEYLKLLRRERKLKNRYLLLKSEAGYATYARMKNFPLLRLGPFKGGLIVEQKTSREYPLGNIANRSVGYEGKDKDGRVIRIGLEGAFSKYLAGVKGRSLRQKIAQNQWKPISSSNQIEPKDGYDVVSTINVNIQDIAHHALLEQIKKYKADHGCAVVMEVATGEVKAISNIGFSRIRNVYDELYNYAVGEAYEPGSVFKTMSLVTLLEEAAIDTSYVVDTQDGTFTIHGKKVRDSNNKGYGKISIAKGIEVSSNTAIVKAVQDIFGKNPTKFVNRLNEMHLNKPLGTPIKGEGEPFIPQPNTRYWSGLSLGWMAYGYGVKMTPLQILCFYNAIANDGVMVKPQMIREVKELNRTIEKYDVEILKERICSQETVSKVKKVLERAVQYGTGRHAVYSENFAMAGKTGTSQANYQDKSKLQYISSFAGFFPPDKPKYSCIVVIHNPDKEIGYYGGDVSGPVFKSIAQKIYTNSLLVDSVKDIEKSTLQAEKDYQKYYDIANRYKTVIPNVVGMPAMDAISLLENMGLKVTISGSGRVINQSISAGDRTADKREIHLKLGNSQP